MSSADTVLERGRNAGVFAAIDALSEAESPQEIAAVSSEAMRRAYWEDRDVGLSIGIAHAGTALLMNAARAEDGTEACRALRIAVKGLLYNVASFTWVGWDEEGITLDECDRSLGLAAARSCLDIVESLELDDLQHSRSGWMFGAHLLTAGRHSEAFDAFVQASEFAARADETADEKLAGAFAALTELAEGRSGAEDHLAQALDDLGTVEYGSDFVAQVTTARAVLRI